MKAYVLFLLILVAAAKRAAVSCDVRAVWRWKLHGRTLPVPTGAAVHHVGAWMKLKE